MLYAACPILSLQHSIFMVTGKDMGVFIDKWIRAGGHAQFHMDFFFNRKRNTVEMNITQVRIISEFYCSLYDPMMQMGCALYVILDY